MTVKEFKEISHLSNKDLTALLKKVQPELDEPLVSRMVSGVIGPSEAVEKFIQETLCKAFAIESDEILYDRWRTISTDEEVRSNRRFSTVYEEISKGSENDPVTYTWLVHRTGLSRRAIQGLISEMRSMGIPIVSHTGNKGFWLAENEQDMRHLIGMYEKQAKRSLMIANRLRGNCGEQLTWVGTL